MVPKNNRRLKLIVLLVFVCLLLSAFWKKVTFAEKPDERVAAVAKAAAPVPNDPPQITAADEPKIEGCAKCHDNIEPMHRYNNKGDVFDKLDEGKDAQGLTCTSCHGGNPAATTQKDAHVQPKFPKRVGL